MALHARSVALTVGAVGDEVDRVARALVGGGVVTVDRARELLEQVRRDDNPAL
jgi:hydroxymethylglutaryl-CoA reductase